MQKKLAPHLPRHVLEPLPQQLHAALRLLHQVTVAQGRLDWFGWEKPGIFGEKLGWWFEPYPSEKYGVKVSWDDDIPNIWKTMFQTTNQNSFSWKTHMIFWGENGRMLGCNVWKEKNKIWAEKMGIGKC